MDELVLLTAVALLGLSQVFQKLGAATSLEGAQTARDYLRALATPPLILALACIFLGTILWLLVLYRMDLSRAYPFLGIGTVFVVALSRFWLGERVSLFRWLGVGLIAVGISMVAGT